MSFFHIAGICLFFGCVDFMTCGHCFYLMSHFAALYSGIIVSALPRPDNFAKRPKHNDNDNDNDNIRNV
jgi:hypothetical protein